MSTLNYQILIALTTIVTGIFTEEKILRVVSGGWAVWTLTHIHAPWLMFLQFGTIGLSWLIANRLIKNN